MTHLPPSTSIAGPSAPIVAARKVLTFSLLSTVLVAVVYAVLGQWMLQALFEGRSLSYLNEIVAWLKIKDARYEDVTFFFNQIHGLVTRSGLLILLTQAILAVLIWRYPHVLQTFFSKESHPLNLAIFRIAFFSMFLLNINEERILWYSTLPADLQVAPPGWKGLLRIMPIDETWAAGGITALRIAAVSAAIGLFSRSSAWMVVILGIYVLGIPQMYGKLNHYHHLIWFAALLGSSRCGDILSADALVRVWKQAKKGIASQSAASNAYALPLKMTWLLMGVIYFFPGFWKFAFSGLPWAFSDNLKYKMYASWANYGVEPTFFRLDQYPALYQLSAFLTIVFELAFIFLILVPSLRLLAAMGGLLFHNATRVFMHIAFASLQVCYVTFIDWHKWLKKLGSRLFASPCRLLFNENSVSQRRIAGSLQTLDLLGAIQYVPRTTLQNLRVIDGKQQTYEGFHAYQKLAIRLPLLWWAVPFLWAGALFQTALPVNEQRTSFSTASTPLFSPPRSNAALIVGSLLIVVNSICGITMIDTWPVGTYPTFATRAGPAITSIVLGFEHQDEQASREISLFSSKKTKDTFAGERLRILVERILATHNEDLRRVRMEALWQILGQSDPSLQKADQVTFYKVQVLVEPDRRGEEVSRQQVLSLAR